MHYHYPVCIRIRIPLYVDHTVSIIVSGIHYPIYIIISLYVSRCCDIRPAPVTPVSIIRIRIRIRIRTSLSYPVSSLYVSYTLYVSDPSYTSISDTSTHTLYDTLSDIPLSHLSDIRPASVPLSTISLYVSLSHYTSVSIIVALSHPIIDHTYRILYPYPVLHYPVYVSIIDIPSAQLGHRYTTIVSRATDEYPLSRIPNIRLVSHYTCHYPDTCIIRTHIQYRTPYPYIIHYRYTYRIHITSGIPCRIGIPYTYTYPYDIHYRIRIVSRPFPVAHYTLSRIRPCIIRIRVRTLSIIRIRIPCSRIRIIIHYTYTIHDRIRPIDIIIPYHIRYPYPYHYRYPVRAVYVSVSAMQLLAIHVITYHLTISYTYTYPLSIMRIVPHYALSYPIIPLSVSISHYTYTLSVSHTYPSLYIIRIRYTLYVSYRYTYIIRIIIRIIIGIHYTYRIPLSISHYIAALYAIIHYPLYVSALSVSIYIIPYTYALSVHYTYRIPLSDTYPLSIILLSVSYTYTLSYTYALCIIRIRIISRYTLSIIPIYDIRIRYTLCIIRTDIGIPANIVSTTRIRYRYPDRLRIDIRIIIHIRIPIYVYIIRIPYTYPYRMICIIPYPVSVDIRIIIHIRIRIHYPIIRYVYHYPIIVSLSYVSRIRIRIRTYVFSRIRTALSRIPCSTIHYSHYPYTYPISYHYPPRIHHIDHTYTCRISHTYRIVYDMHYTYTYHYRIVSRIRIRIHYTYHYPVSGIDIRIPLSRHHNRIRAALSRIRPYVRAIAIIHSVYIIVSGLHYTCTTLQYIIIVSDPYTYRYVSLSRPYVSIIMLDIDPSPLHITSRIRYRIGHALSIIRTALSIIPYTACIIRIHYTYSYPCSIHYTLSVSL
ncbi:hypothetical protein GPJ56_004607 [Histomonas meleagridis]|nr:hypothetical protein GPJ56_004607 [Histomonas meleagridis]